MFRPMKKYYLVPFRFRIAQRVSIVDFWLFHLKFGHGYFISTKQTNIELFQTKGLVLLIRITNHLRQTWF